MVVIILKWERAVVFDKSPYTNKTAAIFSCEQEQVSAPRGFRQIGLRCCPRQHTRITLRRRRRRQNLNSSLRRRLPRSRPSQPASFRRTTLPEHAKLESFISSIVACARFGATTNSRHAMGILVCRE